MKVLERRLRRLEDRWNGTPKGLGRTEYLIARLEAARQRCGLPAPVKLTLSPR